MFGASRVKPASILHLAIRDPVVMAASLASNMLALAFPLSMIQVYDRIIPNQAMETLTALAIFVLAALCAEVLLRTARSSLLSMAGERFEVAAYRDALAALLLEKPNEFNRNSLGELMTRLGSIDRLREIYTGQNATALLDLPFAVLFLAVIAMISPYIAAVVLLVLTVVFLLLRRKRQFVFDEQAARRSIEAQRHSFLAELLSAIESVKQQQIEAFMKRRYERLLTRSAAKTKNIVTGVQAGQGLAATLGNSAPLLVCCTGAFFVIRDDMTVGALAAVVLLTGRVIHPVLQVEAFVAGAQNAKEAEEDLEFLIDRHRRIDGSERLWGVERLDLTDVTTVREHATGIEFRDLDLTFSIGDCIVLEAPDRLACSAFLRLLTGELDLASGQYAINGHPADSYRLDDRVSAIRLLSRDLSFLDGTILQNMTNFEPNKHRHRAMALATEIGLEDFLSKSPKGYSTEVGSNKSANLPGSIADAAMIVGGLITLPDVILFDEPNASLDVEMDRRLLGILGAMKEEAIVLIASNRPSFRALATRTLDLTPYIVRAGDTEFDSASSG